MTFNSEQYLAEYQKYLEQLDTRVLKCRVDGHNMPDEDKELRKGSKSKVKIRRTRLGSYVKEINCLRSCGTTVWKFYDSSGYIERGTKTKHDEYDYPPEMRYLLPAEARSGKGLTREMRAMARLEYFKRLAEYVTDELAD